MVGVYADISTIAAIVISVKYVSSVNNAFIAF